MGKALIGGLVVCFAYLVGYGTCLEVNMQGRNRLRIRKARRTARKTTQVRKKLSHAARPRKARVAAAA